MNTDANPAKSVGSDAWGFRARAGGSSCVNCATHADGVHILTRCGGPSAKPRGNGERTCNIHIRRTLSFRSSSKTGRVLYGPGRGQVVISYIDPGKKRPFTCVAYEQSAFQLVRTPQHTK